jgi:NADP-dependent 3-hydroxy acid dehydrogenase YdfG
MKIAITGHTAGIGQALAEEYRLDGHEIVGLSQREGNNIRNIPKICDQIEPCDVFVNNAQAGYAQTELLFEMARRWQGSDKHIIVISTQMTLEPTAFDESLDQYRIQKVALEQTVHQLRSRHCNPKITLVRPGNIATTPSKTVPPAANTANWSRTLLDIMDMADHNNLRVPDISLGPK